MKNKITDYIQYKLNDKYEQSHIDEFIETCLVEYNKEIDSGLTEEEAYEISIKSFELEYGKLIFDEVVVKKHPKTSLILLLLNILNICIYLFLNTVQLYQEKYTYGIEVAVNISITLSLLHFLYFIGLIIYYSYKCKVKEVNVNFKAIGKSIFLSILLWGLLIIYNRTRPITWTEYVCVFGFITFFIYLIIYGKYKYISSLILSALSMLLFLNFIFGQHRIIKGEILVYFEYYFVFYLCVIGMIYCLVEQFLNHKLKIEEITVLFLVLVLFLLLSHFIPIVYGIMYGEEFHRIKISIIPMYLFLGFLVIMATLVLKKINKLKYAYIINVVYGIFTLVLMINNRNVTLENFRIFKSTTKENYIWYLEVAYRGSVCFIPIIVLIIVVFINITICNKNIVEWRNENQKLFEKSKFQEEKTQ